MKALLVNPPAGSLYHRLGLRFMPLGLAYVGAALRQGGHSVEVIDFEVASTNYRKVRYGNYDVVGITSDTTRWPAAVKVAAVAKEAGAIVVAGGPHASFMDEDALSTGNVDYVVRYEGEVTMVDLMNHLQAGADVTDVLGISYRRDGHLVRTPQRPFIENLDSVPWPARDLFPRKSYRSRFEGRELANVLSSRGCPFNCDFCSCSVLAGLRWRSRSVENILDELEYLNRREGYGSVAFFDDNFTLDPNRAVAISEGILKRGLDIKWWAFSRSDTPVKHPEVVEVMARAGLREAFVGFESSDQETLNSSNKKSTIEASQEAMRVFRKHKVKVWGAFMLGFEGETEDMIKKTIKFAKRLNPYIAQFSLVTPYPGTKLFEKVKGKLHTRDWRRFWGGEPTFKMPGLAPDRLRKLFKKAYWSWYVRPSKFNFLMLYLRSSLRYYTERKNALKRFMALKTS